LEDFNFSQFLLKRFLQPCKDPFPALVGAGYAPCVIIAIRHRIGAALTDLPQFGGVELPVGCRLLTKNNVQRLIPDQRIMPPKDAI